MPTRLPAVTPCRCARRRAERQPGSIMAAQAKAGDMAKAGRPTIGVGNTPIKQGAPTLTEFGVEKNLAKDARALAAVAGL